VFKNSSSIENNNNNGTFHEDTQTFYLAKLFLEGAVFKIKLVEEIKKKLIVNNFFTENRNFLRKWRKTR
jgi:hypothetical protein